jgi:hypothetical protein
MGKTKPEKKEVDFSKLNFPRLAHNYLQRNKKGEYTLDELNLLNGYVNYLFEPQNHNLPKYKVGLMFVCINQPYWQYMEPVIEGAKQMFLPGHDVEIMCWSDMPNYPEVAQVNYGATIFPTDSVEWPYPTLMRYHLFLQQEEYFKKFDYLFYLDLDMRIVNIVGDEILGNGLTASQHPMYAVQKPLIPPYEPNPNSASYIPRPGRIVEEDGKKRFEPLYFAGGFQGGTTETFIPAMKETKKLIDRDLNQNYIPVWNDESAWNRYLFDNPPAVVLDPSYVYPDSMINEYYVKVWGRNYPPKIITLTKPFTVSAEGGAAAQEMMQKL